MKKLAAENKTKLREYAVTVARLQTDKETQTTEYEAKISSLMKDLEPLKTSKQKTAIIKTKDEHDQRKYVTTNTKKGKDSNGNLSGFFFFSILFLRSLLIYDCIHRQCARARETKARTRICEC